MSVKPFLKWLGNKYALIDRINETLPSGKRLIEPFLGSGAVFLNTDYSKYWLSDISADLISLYKFVQSDSASFIPYAKKLFKPSHNTAEAYYELREEFNTTNDAYRKAAIFLYLNKHGFNGLFRYNSKGIFNVSFGDYTKPYFPEQELHNFAERAKKAKFNHCSFLSAMDKAVPGDVVYCDPPYVPISNTANFTGYSAQSFNLESQFLLVSKARELAAKGIPVIISNQASSFVEEHYQQTEIISFDVQRFISCDGSNRKKAKEILAVFR